MLSTANFMPQETSACIIIACTDSALILPRIGRRAQLDNMTNIIFAAPREYIRAAALTGYDVAYMIYRIGRGHHLFRAHGTEHISGGYMVLDTDGYMGGGPSSTLITEIMGECEKNKYKGIVLDTGGKSAAPQAAITRQVASEAAKRGLKLYVHDILADASEHTIVLLQTALSGGTLSGHIGDAVARYGADRVALEIERVRMDFTLPAKSGTGTELTAGELQELMDRHQAKSFLSRDLCAHYFTYHDKKGTHFVLYDDGVSIKRKLSVASKLGIEDAFIFYPHVADIIDKITEQ